MSCSQRQSRAGDEGRVVHERHVFHKHNSVQERNASLWVIRMLVRPIFASQKSIRFVQKDEHGTCLMCGPQPAVQVEKKTVDFGKDVSGNGSNTVEYQS